MLLTALVVLFLGLTDVEAKKRPAPRLPLNETIYRNALKVLQKDHVIGLAVISHEISDRTCECLRSRFWKNISGGAERSLECYAKGSRDAGKIKGILKENITVQMFLEGDMK
uniref:Putative secreted protein n=1 Tax=Amblyomma americanum TaxID=6943 RepID=A0A0C9SET0_AMBAM